MKRPIALVGLMGAGKTAVGRSLAKALGLPWADLDQDLQRRFGPIARQFKLGGEALFRQRESRQLKARLGKGPLVLSTGGGVVLAAQNRALLKRCQTVYLQVPVPVLVRRLRGPQAEQRPLLQGAEPALVLRRLLRQRAGFYRACASLVIRAGQQSPQALALRIAKRLERSV